MKNTQPSDDRIVDGVPKPGKQHQSRHCTHSNSKNIRIKNHQEISHKHPTEITPHIAHDPMAIDAVAAGKVNLKGIVTDVFGLDEAQKAMDYSVNNKADIVKAVIRIAE